MNPLARATVPPDVMARAVGDEVVILHLGTGTYFGLDPVGARAWDLIVQGLSLGEVCDTMAAEFEVERMQLETDLTNLLDQLVAQGLLQVS